jgi:hypothetical protein
MVGLRKGGKVASLWQVLCTLYFTDFETDIPNVLG